MATQTKTAPRTDSPSASPPRRRWWVMAIVGLVALGLGFGLGYLVSERSGTDVAKGDVPAEVVDRVGAFLDAYETAWTSMDSDAVLAMVADDFAFEGMTVEGSAAKLRGEMNYFMGGYQFEYVGDPLVVRAFNMANAYDVSAQWVTWPLDYPEQVTSYMTTYRLVDNDGVLKIYRGYPSEDWFEEQ